MFFGRPDSVTADPPPGSAELRAWTDQLRARHADPTVGLGAVPNLGPVPPRLSSTPAALTARLEALLEFLGAAGIRTEADVRATEEATLGRLLQEARRVAGELAGGLAAAITEADRLLGVGVSSAAFIVPSHLPQGSWELRRLDALAPSPEADWWAVLNTTVAPGRPETTLLDSSDLLHRTFVVLGPAPTSYAFDPITGRAGHVPRRRAWYSAADAVTFTRAARQRELALEAQRQRDSELAAEQQRLAWLASPAGQYAANRKRIDELHREVEQLKVPQPVTAGPDAGDEG